MRRSHTYGHISDVILQLLFNNCFALGSRKISMIICRFIHKFTKTFFFSDFNCRIPKIIKKLALKFKIIV